MDDEEEGVSRRGEEERDGWESRERRDVKVFEQGSAGKIN